MLVPLIALSCLHRSVLKQSSSRSLLAPAAEGTSPKVRWGQNVNLDDKEEEEEVETGAASMNNLDEVLEKQDTEVIIIRHIIDGVSQRSLEVKNLPSPKPQINYPLVVSEAEEKYAWLTIC